MLQAAIVKFTGKQILLKKANGKLEKGEAMVVKARQEIISTEQECEVSKLEVEKYQSYPTFSQRKSLKRSKQFTLCTKRIQGTQGPRDVVA